MDLSERSVSPNRLAAPKAAARHSRFFEQRFADAMALPAVVDRKAELETRGCEIESIARFADDGLVAIELHGGDHAELVGLANMDEALEQVLRQLAHGAEETVVAGARSEPAKVVLEAVGIARLDEPHGDRLAAAPAQHVGMLAEIVEAQGSHGTLQGMEESRRPCEQAAPALLAAYQARQNGLSSS